MATCGKCTVCVQVWKYMCMDCGVCVSICVFLYVCYFHLCCVYAGGMQDLPVTLGHEAVVIFRERHSVWLWGSCGIWLIVIGQHIV